MIVVLHVWFDKPMEGLPDGRVETHFFPMLWNDLFPDQRRSMSEQWDCQHDPAMENDRQYWWDFYQREQALENAIEKWCAKPHQQSQTLYKRKTAVPNINASLSI